MAKSSDFHWVLVDRDATPEIPKRLNVSAYPALLVLGPQEENVHRWSGFLKEPEFLVELDDALRRWKLFREGEPWDAPRPRPEQPFAGRDATAIPAPSDEVPGGIVRCGDELWVAQGKIVYVLDARTHELRREVTLRMVPQDLTTDGKSIYVVDAQWSQGSPIQQLDSVTGNPQRRITTAANRGKPGAGARGICWHDGKLYVLEISGKVHRVDPASGDVEQTFTTGCNWVFGLTFDGQRFVTVGRTAVHFLDPETLQPIEQIDSNYRLRAIGHDGDALLILEQPEFGFGRKHEQIRVWPRKTVIWRLRS